jgi:hypothetical protein
VEFYGILCRLEKIFALQEKLRKEIVSIRKQNKKDALRVIIPRLVSQR